MEIKNGTRVTKRSFTLSNRPASFVYGNQAILSSPILEDSEYGEGENSSININEQQHKLLEIERCLEIEDTSNVSELFEYSTDAVIKYLENHAIMKIGEFKLPDNFVLSAFKKEKYLTRGSDTLVENDYQDKWMRIMERRSSLGTKRSQGYISDIIVVAYAVKIKNYALLEKKNILNPLIQKVKSGGMSLEIFKMPVLQVLVSYSWNTYARHILIIEFIILILWVISFIIFDLALIQMDWSKTDEELKESDQKSFFIATISPVFSIIFMLPFIYLKIYNFFNTQYRKLLTFWNFLDIFSFIFQILIAVCFWYRYGLNQDWFSVVLFFQSFFLLVKAQFFTGVFGNGTSYVELLIQIIWKIKWFLGFILLAILAMGLAFLCLFREEDTHEKFKEFDDLYKSFTAMFGMMIGGFTYDYFFKTTDDIQIAITVLFIFYQIVMAISILNLFIAVMTESYGSMCVEDVNQFNFSRYTVIDELNEILPKIKIFRRFNKPYIHFLIIKPGQDTLKESLSVGGELKMSQKKVLFPMDENMKMHNKIKDLHDTLKSLTNQINTLSEGLAK